MTTTTTLHSVALATIENYRHAALLSTRAYRAGSHRLIGALNDSLVKNIDGRLHSVAPQLGSNFVAARDRVAGIVVKGIDGLTKRTEQAVDTGYDSVAAQVKKVSKFAGGVENATVASGLKTAARLSLPVAQVGLTVSGKVAEGVHALATAVHGKTTVKTTKVAAAAPKKAVARAKRKLA